MVEQSKEIEHQVSKAEELRKEIAYLSSVERGCNLAVLSMKDEIIRAIKEETRQFLEKNKKK